MEKNYGRERVLEPRMVVPAAAWKIDNDPHVHAGEMRVQVHRIHVEWDSFRQICQSCGHDEVRVRAKIMDLVQQRGKLHNPFTGTGGLLAGTVEAIGEPFRSDTPVAVGDYLYALTTLRALPLHLESIESIDYLTGQIQCQGHAILFEASPVCKTLSWDGMVYTMTALDEAGNLYNAARLAENLQTVTILGRDALSIYLYATAVHRTSPEAKIIAVCDWTYQDDPWAEDMRAVLADQVEPLLYLDLAEPLQAYDRVRNTLPPADLVIVAEDIIGTETLAVAMAAETGAVYFTTVVNHYDLAQAVAESMGKAIRIYGFDQYVDSYQDFTLALIKEHRETLEALSQLSGMGQRQTKTQTISLEELEGVPNDFVYESPVTGEMVRDVLNIAHYDCNLIIQGETGVGKEKILSLIHQNSQRRGGPCIKINCATIHENLAESDFFGYEPGAFTGAAAQGRKGYFEMANGGILFLDEIGSLPMNMQSKLLRVLQDNTFYRVGGTRSVLVNVRVVAANNVPLKDLIREGKFREDLYYRLNICLIQVPPLRERREDILSLANHFVKGWNQEYRMERGISEEALQVLKRYHWPGNVRELENVVHRLVIGCKGEQITGQEAEELLHQTNAAGPAVVIQREFPVNQKIDFHAIMERQEKVLLQHALSQCGSTRRAAEMLGLPQTTLARKKSKYKL